MQSTVTAFEDAHQSDSEIIDLREKCMNGFLSICSNLWLAQNRKLSNTSDSDPPTKVKGMRNLRETMSIHVCIEERSGSRQ